MGAYQRSIPAYPYSRLNEQEYSDRERAVERLRAIHRNHLPRDVRRAVRREPRDSLRVIPAVARRPAGIIAL